MLTTIGKKREEPDDGELGTDPEPHEEDEHRGEHDRRDALRGDQDRIDGAADRPRDVEDDPDQESGRDRDREAEQDFLESDPCRRPQNVGFLAHALDDHRGGGPEVARHVEDPDRDFPDRDREQHEHRGRPVVLDQVGGPGAAEPPARPLDGRSLDVQHSSASKAFSLRFANSGDVTISRRGTLVGKLVSSVTMMRPGRAERTMTLWVKRSASSTS